AEVFGAAFFPDDAQVNPIRLMKGLARVAELAGVTLRPNEPVFRLVREGDRIAAVHTGSGCYRPGLVVVTAGAWAGGLLATVGLDLATQPVKGQMLLADCRVAPVRIPLHAGDALFVPRPDGSLMLGVTLEDAGFDSQVTL